MTLFLELRFFAVRCLVGGAVVVAIAGVITLTPSSPDAAGNNVDTDDPVAVPKPSSSVLLLMVSYSYFQRHYDTY